MAARIELCQAWLGEAQRAHVAAGVRPYPIGDNIGATTREYGLFKRRFAEPRDGIDGWGVVSWKFAHKCLAAPEALMAFAAERLAAGDDCVFINPMIGNEAVFLNVWEQFVASTAGADIVAAGVSRLAGIDLQRPMSGDDTAYCNYFIASERFWVRYFAFCDGVLAALDAEVARGSELGRAYAATGRYGADPSLTLQPFVVERLFSSFIAENPDLRCTAMPRPIETYRDKFGVRLGEHLFALSRRKHQAIAKRDMAALGAWDQQRRIFQGSLLLTMWGMDDPDPALMVRR